MWRPTHTTPKIAVNTSIRQIACSSICCGSTNNNPTKTNSQTTTTNT